MSEYVLFFNTNPLLVTFTWTAIWSIVSFGLGILIGHWLAKSRDKRKEFNTVSDPIEVFLQKELSRLKYNNANHTKRTFDFESLSLHLPRKKRQSYAQAVNEYFEAWENEEYRDPCGQVITSPSVQKCIDAIEKLLTFAKHK